MLSNFCPKAMFVSNLIKYHYAAVTDVFTPMMPDYDWVSPEWDNTATLSHYVTATRWPARCTSNSAPVTCSWDRDSENDELYFIE